MEPGERVFEKSQSRRFPKTFSKLFSHELMSNILSYIYRIYFRKYQVSSLRRLSVNRRFETKISRNSFDFRVSISPHKNYRTLNFFGEPHAYSCKYVIYGKKMSKINFFDNQ